MNKLSLNAAVVALGFSFAAVALSDRAVAADNQFVFTYRVADLADAKNANNVYRRLVEGAGRYCSKGVRLSAGMRRAWRDCRNNIVDDVVREISVPILSRIHASKHSRNALLTTLDFQIAERTAQTRATPPIAR